MALISELVTKLKADASQFNAQMAKATKSGEMFANRMKSVGIAVGVAFVGMTVAAGLIAREIDQVTKAVSRLNDASNKLGVSGRELQKLQFAASLVGVEASTLESGMARLVKTVGEANSGNKEATATFKELGLSARELQKLSLDKQYLAFAAAVQKIPDANRQAQLAIGGMGRSAIEQMNVLRTVTTETLAEFDKLGLGLSDGQIQAVDQFGDQLQTLGAIWDSFKQQVVAGLAQPFSDFLQDLKTAVQEMGGFKEVAKDVAVILKDAFMSISGLIGKVLGLLVEARKATISAQIQALEIEEGQTGSPVLNRFGMVGRFVASGGSVDPNVIGTPFGGPNQGRSQELNALYEQYNKLTVSTERVAKVFDYVFNRTDKPLKSFIPSITKAADASTKLADSVSKSADGISTMFEGIKSKKIGDEIERILGVEMRQAFGGLTRSQIAANEQYAKEVRRTGRFTDEQINKMLPYQEASKNTGSFDQGVRSLYSSIQDKKISSGDFGSSLSKLQGDAVGLGPQFVGVLDELRAFGEAAGLVQKQTQKAELKIFVKADKGFITEFADQPAFGDAIDKWLEIITERSN